MPPSMPWRSTSSTSAPSAPAASAAPTPAGPPPQTSTSTRRTTGTRRGASRTASSPTFISWGCISYDWLSRVIVRCPLCGVLEWFHYICIDAAEHGELDRKSKGQKTTMPAGSRRYGRRPSGVLVGRNLNGLVTITPVHKSNGPDSVKPASSRRRLSLGTATAKAKIRQRGPQRCPRYNGTGTRRLIPRPVRFRYSPASSAPSSFFMWMRSPASVCSRAVSR